MSMMSIGLPNSFLHRPDSNSTARKDVALEFAGGLIIKADLGNSRSERVEVTIGPDDYSLVIAAMLRTDREGTIKAFASAIIAED